MTIPPGDLIPRPVVDEMVTKLQAQVDESKRVIAALLRQIHGPRAETSRVVLDAEGQQLIEGILGGLEKPAGSSQPEAPAKDHVIALAPRAKPLGVAARNPTVPIVEKNAPLPPELAAQVAAGTLSAVRSQVFQDRLNTTPRKTVIERTWQMQLVRPTSGEVVVAAPMPETIVPQGVLADDLIHQAVIAKYLDAIPFYRFLGGLAREGVDLPRQTINDAFTAWAGLFAPVAAAIVDHVLTSEVVHADDSWGRVQAPGACTPGHIWTLVGADQVAYRFTAGRTHAALSSVLPVDFTGYLVTDAWSGWRKVADAELAGCNAHARRPFAKLASENADAAGMVKLYAELYAVEQTAKEGGPPAQILDRRRELRRSQSTPVMDRIEAEAARIANAYPQSHPLARGARYIDHHRDQLRRFLDDPILPPDNNAAENALRINALIRKNSLFFGSEDGGARAAVALTVLHSCRMAGIEPLGYLRQVTPRLLRGRSGAPIEAADLMPVKLIATKG